MSVAYSHWLVTHQLPGNRAATDEQPSPENQAGVLPPVDTERLES